MFEDVLPVCLSACKAIAVGDASKYVSHLSYKDLLDLFEFALKTI